MYVWGQPLNKRAFTLIELLAVIVILAIIALIATPIILNIINDSKKQSEQRSAELYLKAAELAIARENLNGEVNISSCSVITETTKGNFEGSKEGDLNCGGKLVKVDIDGTIPTSGTITFANGKIASLSSYKVGNTSYKLQNGSLVVDDGTEEETEPFTGTIYTNSEKLVSIGDSIAPGTKNAWCGFNEEFGSSCDAGLFFSSQPECETFLSDQQIIGTCTEESVTTGLKPGEYYTEETKSSITTNAYLMHDVKDDIVQASYACLKYSEDEEPACVKVGDFGTFKEGTSETDLSNAISGNVKILYDLSDRFESIGGECKCKDADECRCSSERFEIGVDVDGRVWVSDYDASIFCETDNDLIGAYCGSE